MKKYYCFLILFLLLFAAADSTFAQENPNAAQTSDWQRLQSDNDEFSVEMPANYTYFYDKDGFDVHDWNGFNYLFAQMQTIHAAQDKTVMSVEVYKVPSPRKHLDFLLERFGDKTVKITNAPKGFTVEQYEQISVKDYRTGKETEISFVSRYIASKTHIYIVTAANRGKKTAAFERFLSSVRLAANQTGNIKISSLRPLTIENIGEDATNQPKPPVPPANQNQPTDAPKNPTPVLYVTKPFATFTDGARNKRISGVVRLRVTLNKDGRISKIGIVSGLPEGLNRSAFFAALRIKFIPEEKDGETVTVTKVVEYSFKTY